MTFNFFSYISIISTIKNFNLNCIHKSDIKVSKIDFMCLQAAWTPSAARWTPLCPPLSRNNQQWYLVKVPSLNFYDNVQPTWRNAGPECL